MDRMGCVCLSEGAPRLLTELSSVLYRAWLIAVTVWSTISPPTVWRNYSTSTSLLSAKSTLTLICSQEFHWDLAGKSRLRSARGFPIRWCSGRCVSMGLQWR